MAFYFEVRDDSLANFSGDWNVIMHYPAYDFYRSTRYETVSDMLRDVKTFIKREKTGIIPLFFKNGFLLPNTDVLYSDLMDDDLPCGCPSIEECERRWLDACNKG